MGGVDDLALDQSWMDQSVTMGKHKKHEPEMKEKPEVSAADEDKGRSVELRR